MEADKIVTIVLSNSPSRLKIVSSSLIFKRDKLAHPDWYSYQMPYKVKFSYYEP